MGDCLLMVPSRGASPPSRAAACPAGASRRQESCSGTGVTGEWLVLAGDSCAGVCWEPAE